MRLDRIGSGRLLRLGLLGACGLFAASLAAAGTISGTGGLQALVPFDGPMDRTSPALEQRIQAAISAYEKSRPPARPAHPPAEPLLYPFFPQSGIQGQDLFVVNYTDLNPSSPSFRDWSCTSYTYDGHHGHDSVLRSFREQEIGVPVFAVLDAMVVETHDGEADRNTEFSNGPANYVILDHGNGYYGVYYHLRRGSIAVQRGQTVVEGTQIGLTGSSGNSNGPHLHFESRKDGRWFEPSAGPCRPGASFWKEQPPLVRSFYVAGFALANGRIANDRSSLLFDETPRTATFALSHETVGVRLDVRNLPAHSRWQMRVVRPDGSVAVDTPGGWNNPVPYIFGWGVMWFETTFDATGTWRFQLDVNGASALDLPFTVVSDETEIVNRPPNPVDVEVEPRAPQSGHSMLCRVITPLLERDPDYDIVSYRYEWRINRKLVRSVVSAGLTDILPKAQYRKRDRVSCRVTPLDDQARGAAAQATAGPADRAGG